LRWRHALRSNGEVEGPPRSAQSSGAGANCLQRRRRGQASRSRTPRTIVRGRVGRSHRTTVHSGLKRRVFGSGSQISRAFQDDAGLRPLTEKLRDRPEAPDQATRAHTVFRARGANTQAVHGSLQRLLEDAFNEATRLRLPLTLNEGSLARFPKFLMPPRMMPRCVL
jgi:hypothetical protein